MQSLFSTIALILLTCFIGRTYGTTVCYGNATSGPCNGTMQGKIFPEVMMAEVLVEAPDVAAKRTAGPTSTVLVGAPAAGNTVSAEPTSTTAGNAMEMKDAVVTRPAGRHLLLCADLRSSSCLDCNCQGYTCGNERASSTQCYDPKFCHNQGAHSVGSLCLTCPGDFPYWNCAPAEPGKNCYRCNLQYPHFYKGQCWRCVECNYYFSYEDGRCHWNGNDFCTSTGEEGNGCPSGECWPIPGLAWSDAQTVPAFGRAGC